MQQPEHEIASRAGDILEFWAKAAGVALAIWQLVERVGKPYFAWRQKRFEASIRAVLKTELECIDRVTEHEEEIKALLLRVLERQDEIFADLDLFIEVAQDNRERHDETADLLNALGYSSKDRRTTERRSARTPRVDDLMVELRLRSTERRRRVDALRLKYLSEAAQPADSEDRP
jgi:hypothetical protein